MSDLGSFEFQHLVHVGDDHAEREVIVSCEMGLERMLWDEPQMELVVNEIEASWADTGVKLTDGEVDDLRLEEAAIEALNYQAYCQGEIPPGFYRLGRTGPLYETGETMKVEGRCEWLTPVRRSSGGQWRLHDHSEWRSFDENGDALWWRVLKEPPPPENHYRPENTLYEPESK